MIKKCGKSCHWKKSQSESFSKHESYWKFVKSLKEEKQKWKFAVKTIFSFGKGLFINFGP